MAKVSYPDDRSDHGPDALYWYKREEGSTRNYKLLPRSKRWLTVQAIIRIDGLRFEGGRDPRSGSQVFSVVSRELSEACLS